MIKGDMNYNLIYTRGDTLAIEYELESYKLQQGDIATFSIKQKGRVVLDATIKTPGLSKLLFVISAEDMAKLPVGKYTYDMYIKFADGGIVYSVDYMREFRIVEVAHELL